MKNENHVCNYPLLVQVLEKGIKKISKKVEVPFMQVLREKEIGVEVIVSEVSPNATPDSLIVKELVDEVQADLNCLSHARILISSRGQIIDPVDHVGKLDHGSGFAIFLRHGIHGIFLPDFQRIRVDGKSILIEVADQTGPCASKMIDSVTKAILSLLVALKETSLIVTCSYFRSNPVKKPDEIRFRNTR
jgi:hypothetical protein